MKNITSLVLIVTVFCLCSGFRLSDTDRLRREFRKKVDAELAKIIEKTPNAKARQRWRDIRDKAVKAIDDAVEVDALRFASGELADAREYLKRARRYSARREYAKAAYLGKQSIKMAETALKKAKETLAGKEKVAAEALAKNIKQLKALKSRLAPDNADAAIAIARLELQKGYVENLIRTGRFDEALKACAGLEQEIADAARLLPTATPKVQEEHWL
jgi:hypothetical protein